jgi:hypothetical protein
MTADDVLTSAQAAAYLHVSDKTMRRLRDAKKGPAYSRTQDGRAVYVRTDLDAWLKTQLVASIIYVPLEQAERTLVTA